MTRILTICGLVLALAGTAGCSSLRDWLFGDLPKPPPAPAMVVPPPPADPLLNPAPPDAANPFSDQTTDLDRLRGEAADLKGKLATKGAEIASREKAIKEAERKLALAPLVALCRWATYVGAAAMIGGVVLAGVAAVGAKLWPLLRLVPLGWKGGALVALAGALAFGASQALAAALPWIGAASIAAVILLVLGLLTWAALTWKRAGVALAGELDTYANALPAEARSLLDRDSRKRQGRAAVAGDHLLEVARG